VTDFASFDLPEPIQRALVRLNFTAPTPIQAQTIPLALAGRDLVASAETGSGKTAAFCIPILSKLWADRDAAALIIVPTRELAGQIAAVIDDLTGRAASVRPVILIGGMPMRGQERALRSSARIIIATPGRLVDHLQRQPTLLRKMCLLVLDEADRMLDMGFAPQLREVLKRLPTERQTLLFSATYPNDIKELAAGMLRNPERIAIGSVVRPVEVIDQKVIEVEEESKNSKLIDELQNRSGAVLVFTRTKRRADKVAKTLSQQGESACQIHGGRSQRQRDLALQGLRSGKIRVLVATDIAARGIDVPEIEHVINYDLPFVAEDYLHRIGRTGRAGRSGSALCMVAPADRKLWRSIERLMDRREGRSSKEQREETQSLRREFAAPRVRRHGSSAPRHSAGGSFGNNRSRRRRDYSEPQGRYAGR
jgi:ATP-dependent RNA helicase DeaD